MTSALAEDVGFRHRDARVSELLLRIPDVDAVRLALQVSFDSSLHQAPKPAESGLAA